MSAPNAEPRATTINSVTTPLGFFVLGLLIVDGTIAAMAITLADFRFELVWTLIGSIPLFILVVLFLAVWRPEALKGDRPLHDSHARQLGYDLYISLDGALSNLAPLEREEAWLTIIDVLESETEADRSYRRFCSSVAVTLTKLTNLGNRRARTVGPVQTTPAAPTIHE